MGLFLLLWLLAIVIVFSVEITAGVYWFNYIYNKAASDSGGQLSLFAETLQVKYNNYLFIYFGWFLFISSLLLGIYFGWFFERKFKLLSKINLYWQKTQPEFYRNTKGETRVFLPWLVLELPILLVAILNILILLAFELYLFRSIAILIFIIGMTSGQLIELAKEYKVTITLDRPEKPPESLIQKINPKFQSNYSLFLGQLYCRGLIPFFFLYILILIPGWLIVIPNYSDKNLVIILFSIIFGITLRWFYDKKDYFYFGKMTFQNFIFTTGKLLFLVNIILFALISINPYLLIFSSIFCGFIVPWHPEKLR